MSTPFSGLIKIAGVSDLLLSPYILLKKFTGKKTATSLLSPNIPSPCFFNTPITVNFCPYNLIFFPNGLPLPNSPSATSLPITITGDPELDSDSLNNLPVSILKDSISKNSFVDGFTRMEFTVLSSYLIFSFRVNKLKDILSIPFTERFNVSNSS